MVLDESRALIVSRDQTMSFIDFITHAKLKALPLFEPIESAVIAGSQMLYTVGEEGILKCWVTEKAKLIRSASLSRLSTKLLLLEIG